MASRRDIELRRDLTYFTDIMTGDIEIDSEFLGTSQNTHVSYELVRVYDYLLSCGGSGGGGGGGRVGVRGGSGSSGGGDGNDGGDIRVGGGGGDDGSGGGGSGGGSDCGTARDLETLVVTAWAIWYNRNQWVHESKKQNACQIWDFASSLLQDYKEAVKFFQLGPSTCKLSWKKPPMGVYKINVDGATSEKGRKSSIGMIIRDYKGEAVAGLCKLLPGNFTVVETEALAVEASILLAKELGLQQVIIESNSLTVVQSISSKEVSGETGHIIQGILSILDCFSSWQIRHLKRDFNKVAHELAHYANCNETSSLGFFFNLAVNFRPEYNIKTLIAQNYTTLFWNNFIDDHGL
ncbi:hypothetical protein SO802_033266 [Lithocarpus litseifolius]|uniref:RNase H type-1 domain-containing protein n=1 Tax=Lithocarpus litseifolius TaxID=425828 RepID=A0AAW2BEJ8_9ROSI